MSFDVGAGSMTDEELIKQWKKIDWDAVEEKLRKYQCEMTIAAYMYDNFKVRTLQVKIVKDLGIRCLAVKRVAESKAGAGVDGVKWTKPLEMMKAAMALNDKNYQAKPMRIIKFRSRNSNKFRTSHILTYFDRAMSILQGFTLLPVTEAQADENSFAFRPNRSTQDVHACILSSLRGINAPLYVVCADVKAFYATVRHSWLVEHVPMDKNILSELLNSGIVFSGELFPSDDLGISEGSNLSPYLGNFCLDGLQSYIYQGLYGNDQNIKDRANGRMIRFADDILVTVREKKTGYRVLEILKEFLEVRGLKLSPDKTKVALVADGFTFLSRTYIRKNDFIYSYPADEAVEKFIADIRSTIIDSPVMSQRQLILLLNQKLQGWANYYRETDALLSFKKIDAAVQTALLEKSISLHPKLPIEKIKHKYWYEEHDGRYSYALPDDKSIKVIHISDTLLLSPKLMSFDSRQRMNPFIKKYFEQHKAHDKEIQNVTGKYKSIWKRQNGICHYCGRHILIDQPKAIVPYDLSKKPSKYNLAYIHQVCEKNEYIDVVVDDVDDGFVRKYNVLDCLKNIVSEEKDENISIFKSNWKYQQLKVFFEKSTKSSITLTFKDIEKIIESTLPPSSSTKRFWYRNGKKICICHAWESEGYKTKKLNLEKKKITLYRVDDDVGNLEIPHELLNKKIPINAIWELENHFAYVIKKYGLDSKLD